MVEVTGPGWARLDLRVCLTWVPPRLPGGRFTGGSYKDSPGRLVRVNARGGPGVALGVSAYLRQAGDDDMTMARTGPVWCRGGRRLATGAGMVLAVRGVAGALARLDLGRLGLDQAAPGGQPARPGFCRDGLRHGHQNRGAVRWPALPTNRTGHARHLGLTISHQRQAPSATPAGVTPAKSWHRAARMTRRCPASPV
jgi:hypothetical protein